MNATGTLVRLHGKLAQEMGRSEWHFVIERPREAIAAINANTGGRLRHIIAREGKRTEYQVLVNGKAIPTALVDGKPNIEAMPAELYASGEIETLDIVPVPAGGGGGGGLWQIIAGVVLIIAGVVMAFYPGGQPFAPYVIMMGVGLLAGGIAAALSPTPQLGVGSVVNKREGDGEEKTKASYLFNGVQNTTSQGGPVPICYGRLMVGSQLVSIGIHGGSIAGAVIGGLKPPPPDSPFYAASLWDDLHAQPRSADVASTRQIRQMTKAQVASNWSEFDLPDTFPTNWPDKKKRGKAVPIETKRNHLYAVGHLFNSNEDRVTLDEITLAQARNLYRFLSLSTIPDPSGSPTGYGFARAGWKLIVEHLGTYYQTHP